MADDDWEICDFSSLAKIMCAHCLGHTLGDEKPGAPKFSGLTPSDEADDGYEIVGSSFTAQYKGRCAIDSEHPIKLGTKVARVQHVANPFIPVPGVACQSCIRQLPRAK